MANVNSAGMTNPTGGMVFFLIVTTIYSILSYNLTKDPTKDESNASRMYFGIYLMMVLVGEFFVNLSLTAGTCGTPQYSTALITTLLPWGFMFGILVLLLSMFPGWSAPFSNTFGYGIAMLAGLNDTMNDIIEPNPKGVKSNPGNEAMEQALAHIYSDKSMLVNEITPTNFEYFWNNMKGVFQKGVFGNIELKKKLFSFVQLKYSVAEYVWYILGGMLVTSVSFNYIVNSACSMSADEMKKRHAKYQEEMDAAHENSQTEEKRVYSSYD